MDKVLNTNGFPNIQIPRIHLNREDWFFSFLHQIKNPIISDRVFYLEVGGPGGFEPPSTKSLNRIAWPRTFIRWCDCRYTLAK